MNLHQIASIECNNHGSVTSLGFGELTEHTKVKGRPSRILLKAFPAPSPTIGEFWSKNITGVEGSSKAKGRENCKIPETRRR